MDQKNDYGKTLNLPQTEFPMRGNLPKREPDMLQKWQDMDLYHKTLENREGAETFILHDGPPYANGDIHLGHALNKVLKDIIIRYKTMSGYKAPYIPGWDTHGLPIEQRAIKALGLDHKKTEPMAFRDKCKEFALGFVETQKKEFKRLGVRADWDNAYVTLRPEYESVQIGIFGKMAQKGYIYKGLKPVYWCPSCETALAEAEIEYADIESPSIYVKFPVKDGKGLLPDDAYMIIWTTTPWTIPANVGVCLNPEFDYRLIEVGEEKWIVGEPLLERFIKDADVEDYNVTDISWKGKELEGATCYHPLWDDRESLIIVGDHVTDEAGTGAVHTAPGHGEDDFNVGKVYNLPVLSPVDATGHFTEEARDYAGLEAMTKGNQAVVVDLNRMNRLVRLVKIEHSYPHCWRCKNPILFRATEQWFASIDGFRKDALAEIDKVKWIPSWGHDRIYNMVRDRGDWCISRQRTWGVPIPIFYCEECNEPIINDETISHLQELFKNEGGSQVWWAKEAEDLIPKGLKCPKCGHTHFRKETDIMDVWFDSGSSFAAVIGDMGPIDLYLEGSDQHRGWFNSSLSISVATQGKAPYKQVLTHGFLVDENGRKQSKSIGNVVDPLKVIDQMGADVLRLWVSSADYRGDMANSPAIMKQISEAYRKIRNTIRYFLGNISDFDAEKDAVPYNELQEIDRYALHLLKEMNNKALAGYENYEFHQVFHAIHHFCVVDMSAFYLDIIKDRLYSFAPDDKRRRSAQTVLAEIVQVITRLIAPILVFTAEEVWSYLRKDGEAESVHLLDFVTVSDDYLDSDLAAKWEKIIAFRETVSKELEAARRDKIIGHSLDSTVVITADKDLYPLLKSLEDGLADIFIVSGVILNEGAETAVEVRGPEGNKCGRCWKYSTDTPADGVCPRCAEVLKVLNINMEA